MNVSDKVKRRICAGLKICIFIVVFVFLALRIDLAIQVYNTKPDDVDRRTRLFYELPDNTVDVLFLGSSHTYFTFIPQQIYDEYGITSADLATSSQSIQNTYYLLKEAYKHQKPKVVFLDIYNLMAASNESVLTFRLHFTSGISNLPDYSLNKYKEYKEIKNLHYGYSDEVKLEDAYGVISFRNEYDRGPFDPLQFMSIMISPAAEYSTFGYYPATTVAPIEQLSPGISSGTVINLEETTEYEYFVKLCELVKENDTRLVMVRAPYNSPGYDNLGLYDQIISHLEEENIGYIDYFSLVDELEIDLSTDFRDEDHLNILGARKATKYISDYLHNEYSLPDHRGEGRYYLWEENNYNYNSAEQAAREAAGLADR